MLVDVDVENMGKRKRKASQSHVIVGGSTSGNGKSCNTRRQVEAQNQNRSLEVGRQIDVIDHQKDDIDSQSDVIDRLAEGNDEIDHRQRSKISEFYKLEQKTKGLEKRLSESREKIKALEAQNTAYKDDLFRYQPATQLSESEISQRYENLSDRILAWVDHEIRQFDEEWKAIYGEYPPNCLLFSCDQRIPKGAYFLETYSEHGGEFLLRSAIHCLLQRKLFDNEDVLFAVSGKEEDLLEAIEQGMEKLEQNKGMYYKFCFDCSKTQLLILSRSLLDSQLAIVGA